MINYNLGSIEYSDDITYREVLCTIFNVPFDNEIEDVGDIFSFEPALDSIYAATSSCPYFSQIYTIAAGFMLSEDPLTGVCILCAYDYLRLFYAALTEYMECANKVAYSEHTCNKAKELLDFLQRK